MAKIRRASLVIQVIKEWQPYINSLHPVSYFAKNGIAHCATSLLTYFSEMVDMLPSNTIVVGATAEYAEKNISMAEKGLEALGVGIGDNFTSKGSVCFVSQVSYTQYKCLRT